LVGNKSDLVNKKAIDTNTAQEFAATLGVPFLETSAKTSTNVEQAFITMAAEIKNRLANQPILTQDGGNGSKPVISQPLNQNKSGGCCG
jgi:Ras-related protein Rab-1A